MRDLGVWMVDFGVGRMDRVHLLKDVVGDKLNVLQIVCVIQLGKLCHFGGILDQFKGMYGKMLKYNDLWIGVPGSSKDLTSSLFSIIYK